MLLTGCSSSDPSTDSSATASVTTTSRTAEHSRAELVDTGAGLAQPGKVHVVAGEPLGQARLVVHIAQRLYAFCNTGNANLLDGTVAPAFRDNTLPTGRPQGPGGVVAASKTFRAAVPDLACELTDLYVVGDTFTTKLVFRGHFTGTYNKIPGKGQTIKFNAIDIQHLGNGRTITEDRHLEDNLTFLQQAGLVTVATAK